MVGVRDSEMSRIECTLDAGEPYGLWNRMGEPVVRAQHSSSSKWAMKCLLCGPVILELLATDCDLPATCESTLRKEC